MPLSDEAFQRQVLGDLATIKANQAKDEKSFDEYKAKVDQLIGLHSDIKNMNRRINDVESSLTSAEKHLQGDITAGDERLRDDLKAQESRLTEQMTQADSLLRNDVQAKEQHLREDITKEVSSIYRTAAIVGACVSFVISLIVSKWG